MRDRFRLTVLIGSLALASFAAPAALAQYPPIDIDIENAQNNEQNVNTAVDVANEQNQSQFGAFDEHGYLPISRASDGKSLPRTGTDGVMLALYALTLFSLGMLLLRQSDKRRFRLALADRGSAAETPSPGIPVAEPERRRGLFEGDLLLPPEGD